MNNIQPQWISIFDPPLLSQRLRSLRRLDLGARRFRVNVVEAKVILREALGKHLMLCMEPKNKDGELKNNMDVDVQHGFNHVKMLIYMFVLFHLCCFG